MITAFVRTIILYFLIVVGMRLMGKRQIGELEPSELVLTMMISDLAAVPMQDFGIPLLSGLLPILTLLALSLLLSQLSLRSLRLRALICGTPTVLIRGSWSSAATPIILSAPTAIPFSAKRTATTSRIPAASTSA